MDLKIFDNMLDVLAQKGVVALMEGFGFTYLVLAILGDKFQVEQALVGLCLVLIGASFEYLVTKAKVEYIKIESEKDRAAIEKYEAKISEKEAALDKKFNSAIETLNSFGKGKQATISGTSNA